MKRFFALCSLLLLLAAGFTSCSDDAQPIPSSIQFDGDFKAKPTKTSIVKFTATADLKDFAVKEAPENWQVTLDQEAKTIEVTPSANAYGTHQIVLCAQSLAGEQIEAVLSIPIAEMSTPESVYVLNENSWAPGSLTYIDEDGDAFTEVYNAKNNEQLGVTTEDMFFRNGKIYIIAMDGTLTVADAKTMVKIDSFNLYLSNSSHIAVFDDENIYVRDDKGLHLFNSTTKSLTPVEGMDYAPKNPMLIIGDKLYVAGGLLRQIVKGETKIAKQSSYTHVSAIAKADDGMLYVATSRDFLDNSIASTIKKVNPETLEVIEEHEIKELNLEHGYEASNSISVRGNMIFYSGTKATIWRHDFATRQTKMLFDASKNEQTYPQGITYNTVAVHPVTGYVYMNRISGYGTYDQNKIIVLQDMGEKLEILKIYDNLTAFPAGIFFATSEE